MKRVLIIAYFFPPASNMGSHRILRFVRHLREHGWEPVVLTGQFPGCPQVDERLLERVPADVEVHRVSSVDLADVWHRLTGRKKSGKVQGRETTPVASQGLTTFLNRWVMVPDKYFPWIGPAARAGRRLLAERRFDAIYSTLDPASAHLVARRIARATGVPWVAEFRDLWLGSPYFSRAQPTALHRAIHAQMERQVVREARLIVALSRGIHEYFTYTYPTRNCRLVYNSFDPGEYGPLPAPSPGFTVVYAGALYSSRSPAPFLAGWAEFVRQRQLGPAEAHFEIVGGSTDLDLAALARQQQIESHVRLVGRVPHAEALRRMQASTVLLAIQSPDDVVHVPGKLFEYIGARRPILLVSRPCEVAELIAQEQLGWVAAPEPAAVAARLSEVYDQWLAHGHAGLMVNAADRFSIAATTRQLAELLATAGRAQ